MEAATTASAPRAVDRSRQALWAALGLIVLWGANFSVQKAVFQALSPGGFLFVRYLMMPLAAALLLCLRFGTRWPRLSRADAFALLRLGLVGHLLHVGLVTYGIYWSTAFSSSIILACGPVFTLLILHWHGHEALTRGSVAGVAVAASVSSSSSPTSCSAGTGRRARAISCCSSRPRSSRTTRSPPSR
jgi:drug/metabolite transporter (DMT)-like permease